MEPKASSSSSSKSPKPKPNNRDFLIHLEAYLAKRDGVDKLLKISRYATKIILASSVIPESLPLSLRLKSFESSVGVSRKAFRLGKFVQDINAFRLGNVNSKEELILSILAYGGEGVYYFVEQFIWLGKAGLIDKKYLNNLQKISAWCEFIGYIGSVSLKVKELRQISEDEECLLSTIEVSIIRGIGYAEEEEKLRKLRLKKLMKSLSVIQDFSDGLMALADIRDGKDLGIKANEDEAQYWKSVLADLGIKANEDEVCVLWAIELLIIRGIGYADEMEKLRLKKLMKRLSIINGLMALADIRDGKGMLSAPLLLSTARLLSVFISTHKNWISC